MYRCPVCAAALLADPATYRCGSGHVFDIAREGYVNLLTGRSARRRSSGDEPQMVRARRLFLDAGHYERLRSVLLSQVPTGSVLDVGCGEGYYSRPLSPRAQWIGGADMSKHAVKLAAHRDPRINYAVANAFDLPIMTASIDTVVNVFGPVAPQELRRVMSNRGVILAVAPGPDHLIELKRVLLTTANRHPLRGPVGLEGFARSDLQRISYEIDVEQPQLDALLTMTPYRWRATRERADALSKVRRMSITADFLLCTYRNP